jgi:hypothetical protein
MTDRTATRRRLVRGSLLLLLAGLAAFAAYGLAVVPPTVDSWYPGCMFHRLTGLHCPGCGLTRAAHAALNGHLAQALAYNLLAPIIVGVVGLAMTQATWHMLWGTSPRYTRLWNWVLIGLGVVLVVFGIVRNIPVYPFTLLAPHEI